VVKFELGDNQSLSLPLRILWWQFGCSGGGAKNFQVFYNDASPTGVEKIPAPVAGLNLGGMQ
jgi:hypothetical protein